MLYHVCFSIGGGLREDTNVGRSNKDCDRIQLILKLVNPHYCASALLLFGAGGLLLVPPVLPTDKLNNNVHTFSECLFNLQE